MWRHLAAPGAYWSGRERVAMARAARNAWSCPRCAAPGSTALRHLDEEGLSPEVIDTVHRLTTDPGRVTRQVCQDFLARGHEPGHYAELVAVTAMAASSQVFCHALGVAPHAHPEPLAGDATGERAQCEDVETAWVPLARTRDPNILRALSLVPSDKRQVFDLAAVQYVPTDRFLELDFRRSIDRAQMELVAARVSALNQCFY
jgi:hypothetical protein